MASEHPPAEGRWEAVIGLEIHVQLATRSKMFCGNTVEFGAPPNTHVCPVCLGLPGALPVINAEAVRLAVRAALGLECTVHESSVFARKNYFYPDLPKGYQITQFDRPIATEGWVQTLESGDPGSVPGRGPAEGASAGEGDSGDDSTLPLSRAAAMRRDAPGLGRGVRIRRIHLEEDAGKSIHDRFVGRTAVDLNRAGVPLVEIVTEPDIRSPGEARAFLNRLKQTLQYLQVSDCDMEEGSLRVDANVSLRPRGAEALGTKTEVKNMNSFSNVERALTFEIARQAAELDAGRAITQQTLLWDAGRGEARPMRSKEESHDYRYFPEPDLPPLVVSRSEIEAERAALPELPAARLRRFMEAYGLPAYDAGVLTAARAVADYFEAVAAGAGDAKAASNWVMGDVLGWANERGCDIAAVPIPARAVAQLIRLVGEGTLSSSMARKVFERVAETGKEPGEIVAEEGLAQVRDSGQLEAWVAEVVGGHPAEVERYRQGEDKLLGFLMGQIMKRSRGKADPRQVTELLKASLGR
ncbi:MAG TPA: Asp-tRNA(Asn)/Glu-tRNA(Gln) amidotransferase subunit GatB [Longimicrobiales bacterium]